MTAVFFSKNPNSLKTVYSKDVREKLFSEVKFIPDMSDFSDESLQKRADELKNVDIIFSTWGMPSLDGEQIEKYLPDLKAVFYGAGSVQYFARPFIERGIKVISAWAANAVPVAEFTSAQIILANKGYFQRFQHISDTTWKNRYGNGGCSTDYTGNYHARVGIIGAGMIGTMVINIMKQHNCDLYVFDPFMSEERASDMGVTKCSLVDLFRTCPVISNHLANNAQTVGMINSECFSNMLPNAVFINTGRGAQVDEKALCRAMKENPDRAALLDVTYPEPPEEGSELYALPNVFLSPHIAGSLGCEVERMGLYMYQEFCAYKENKPLKYEVSMKMLETMA